MAEAAKIVVADEAIHDIGFSQLSCGRLDSRLG